MKKYYKMLISLFISTLIPMIVEKFIYNTEVFSIIRFIIVFSLLFIALLPFCIFNREKALQFLYDKRYIIGFVFFSILVLFGFHGSSISIYNSSIQPNHDIKIAHPILGTSRLIRGDEWAVGTPTLLSQAKNNFNETSRILNAKSNNVTLYPKIIAKTVSALSIPNYLGFLFLPTEQAFSFSWYFGYFLVFFASFEFLMLLTKKNKFYSAMGSIIISFSAVVQWWECWTLIAYGEVAIVLFDKYLKQKKVLNQVLLAVLIGIVGCCYIMCLYPAWQVPYGYLFLILSIWIMKINKDNCSLKKVLMLIFIIFIVIGIIIVPTVIKSYDIYLLMTNTVYPGKRVSLGGGFWPNLFNYFISMFNTFKESTNPSEMAQFTSLYPIPIIMGVYYWYNNKRKLKKDFLLVGLTVLAILLTVWNYVTLPEWLVRISLLSMSTPQRSVVVSGFICLLLLIYCLSNYATKNLKYTVKFQNMIIAICITAFGVYVTKNQYINYFSNKFLIFDFVFFVPVIFLCLLNWTKTNKIVFMLLAIVTFVTGVLVHPLNIGLKVIYDKPVSKEIEKLEKKNKNANWIVVGEQYYVQNYLVANGADTINSTNYYPNFELWKKIGLEDKEEIYNRYAHILVDITLKKSSVKLNYMDQLGLSLNNNDVCKLNVDYLLTTGKTLDEYNSNKVKFSKIYDEDNILIYSVNCN